MFSVVTDHPDVPGDAPIIGLDHVILAVSDLEAAQAKARKLGFTTTDITAHVGWGTANTCVMFRGLAIRATISKSSACATSASAPTASTTIWPNRVKACCRWRSRGGPSWLPLLDENGWRIWASRTCTATSKSCRACLSAVRWKRGPPARAAVRLRAPDLQAVWADRFVHHENGTLASAVQMRMADGSTLGEGYEALLTGKLTGSTQPIGADLEFYSAEDWAQIYPDAEAHEAIVYQVEDLTKTGEFLANSGLAFRPAMAGYRGYIVYPGDAGGAYAVFTDGT